MQYAKLEGGGGIPTTTKKKKRLRAFQLNARWGHWCQLEVSVRSGLHTEVK